MIYDIGCTCMISYGISSYLIRFNYILNFKNGHAKFISLNSKKNSYLIEFGYGKKLLIMNKPYF